MLPGWPLLVGVDDPSAPPWCYTTGPTCLGLENGNESDLNNPIQSRGLLHGDPVWAIPSIHTLRPDEKNKNTAIRFCFWFMCPPPEGKPRKHHNEPFVGGYLESTYVPDHPYADPAEIQTNLVRFRSGSSSEPRKRRPQYHSALFFLFCFLLTDFGAEARGLVRQDSRHADHLGALRVHLCQRAGSPKQERTSGRGFALHG